MPVKAYQRHEAGIELFRIAEGFKKYRPELNDQAALKLAITGNPELGETYMGIPVRRDAIGAVKKFIFEGGALPEILRM